jgi:hypothetical protein
MDARMAYLVHCPLVGGASALQQFKATWFSVETLSSLFVLFLSGQPLYMNSLSIVLFNYVKH